jgi:hypothetical protein
LHGFRHHRIGLASDHHVGIVAKREVTGWRQDAPATIPKGILIFVRLIDRLGRALFAENLVRIVSARKHLSYERHRRGRAKFQLAANIDAHGFRPS